ncbi:MAG: flagellar protein FliS [Lachnospiraceae bacterium]|nr:flagellar protein FliS [Lachnospiraceae bacterium]
MTQEKKQEFTRRLSCCNKGEMIVIMYDILFAYLEEGIQASGQQDYQGFKTAVGKASQVVARLMEDLDFSYEISGNLYAEYQFVKKLLAMAVCKNTAQNLRDAHQVLKNLYDAFQEAAQQDTSEPLMQHAQQVVAGITYQKGSLTETLQGSESSRGFLA